ncbi:MAG: prephenate dehydrogenase/arogenate dehydrogenase family protein [Haloarculaceae archaeon]
MRLLVVGAGEMGTWFARTLAAELPDRPVVAFADADEETAAAAADAVGGRVASPDAADRFDVVCFAVPIPAVEGAVDEWAARADGALVDVVGVMTPVVERMAAAGPDVERVSLHPLFAPANAPGNVAVVADAPGPVTDRVRAALSAAGNNLFETTATEHDEAMETVQARAHAAVLAFGLAAEPVAREFQTPVSSALFDLVEGVTGNDPRVYSDIQAAFDGAADVADAADRLADAGPEAFADLYREADASLGGPRRE